LFVGYTSGAAVQAAKQFDSINEFKPNDLGCYYFSRPWLRYLSKIYSDKWMETQDFLIVNMKNY